MKQKIEQLRTKFFCINNTENFQEEERNLNFTSSVSTLISHAIFRKNSQIDYFNIASGGNTLRKYGLCSF